MTNIFVSNDDVKVIGGTSEVYVDVDFGPQGDRGSLFLVGLGDPNVISHNVTLQALDIYINVQETDEDYLVIYQYQDSPGGLNWVSAGKLITDKFSAIKPVAFTNGEASDLVEFRVSNIVPLSLIGGLTEQNFNIQCTFSHPENPIAHSISVNPITINSATGDLTLPINIRAVEFSEGAWTGLNGTAYVHFLITVV